MMDVLFPVQEAIVSPFHKAVPAINLSARMLHPAPPITWWSTETLPAEAFQVITSQLLLPPVAVPVPLVEAQLIFHPCLIQF